jgi:hypothetical protein
MRRTVLVTGGAGFTLDDLLAGRLGNLDDVRARGQVFNLGSQDEVSLRGVATAPSG